MLIITSKMLLENLEAAVHGAFLQAPRGYLTNQYRNIDGYRCAIGASLPNSVLFDLDKTGQNSKAVDTVDWAKLRVSFTHLEFALAIQDVHDSGGARPLAWLAESDARRFAVKLLGESAVSALPRQGFIKNRMSSAAWIAFIGLVRQHLDSIETA